MDDQEDASKQGEIAELDADEDVTLVDAEEDMNADVQGKLAESQTKVYHLDLQHAEKVLSMQDTNKAEPAEVEEVIEVVTATKLMIKVVTTVATTITTAQVPKASAPRRRRGDDVVEQIKRREREDNEVMRYQALKRNPLIEAQARKNMIIYLKNMTGFKMHFFKGMTYNEIRPIFKKYYNLNHAFLERVKEEVTGQKKEGCKRKVNDDDDVFIEAKPLSSKVYVVDYQIHYENSKPYHKIIKADGTHKLFLSFITLLKNYDREDLEMLWKLVQE
uniref:Uncharacterized protein n=1 Tax=Tanacetum cinerariifolium TaxID=118510 RepID=A0A6L2L0E3_TANCI|nr:hypothetical protein [Tanacetum cinerariifolium]